MECRVPRGSGGRTARSLPKTSNPLQILYKTDHSGASGASWLKRPIRQILSKCFKSFTKRSILEPRAPHGSGGPSARSFPNASNPLQILYKTEHSGASGASWLRRPIRQILSRCFKFFTNPLQNWSFWSLGRLLPQEADPPDPFQMLQILYKTEHSGASGASWLRRPIRQILSKCFKSFTNPLQNWAFWSFGRLMAQEAYPPDPCQRLQILYKSFTKQSILEPRAPHGSGGPSARSFPNASNPLQILYKTEHSGAWHATSNPMITGVLVGDTSSSDRNQVSN